MTERLCHLRVYLGILRITDCLLEEGSNREFFHFLADNLEKYVMVHFLNSAVFCFIKSCLMLTCFTRHLRVKLWYETFQTCFKRVKDPQFFRTFLLQSFLQFWVTKVRGDSGVFPSVKSGLYFFTHLNIFIKPR